MRRSRAPYRPRALAPIPYVRGVDYDVLDELMGYSLRRAQVAMFVAFDEATKGEEITPPRFTSLVLIGANPGMSQSLLGEILGIARSGAKMLVDWMEARGLVERRNHQGDARAWGLHLTKEGERMRRAMKRRVLAKERERTASLDAGERRELLRLLTKLTG